MKHSIKTSYTMYKGRCYTFRFSGKVKPIANINLKLKAVDNLIAWVHTPGKELWANIGYWPHKPKLITLGNEGLMDFVMKKSVSYKIKSCKDELDYNQYGKEWC